MRSARSWASSTRRSSASCPAVYRELSAALDAADTGAQLPPAPAFLRFGSWVGGDRDGNPHITAQVTRETMLIQSEHILRGLESGRAPASAAV